MARDEAYRKAEETIEKARRSGAKELDLRRMEPTELPESLGQLTQLQALDLSENQLTALPESLGHLRQLQSLDLSGNQLTALPESLGQLTQLQDLDLSYNELTELPEWLGQLKQLQTLYLVENQLAALPWSLGQFTRLQELELGGNSLDEIPDGLCQIKSLRSLSLSSCEISCLPESIGNLDGLELLNLVDNRLTALPKTLCKLEKLESLGLSQNPWIRLSDALGDLSQIMTLGLASANLSELPDWICRLTKLKHLYLGTIQEIGRWKHFSKTNKNQLVSLPEWIGNLRDLELIDLESNGLRDLPSSFVQLEHLEELNLDNNPLNPELEVAYEEGLDSVKRYLRELAKGAKKRYEAKLLILGDGNEGKTCVSRALRGLPFCVQRTTHGVDVEQWKFAHPDYSTDNEKEITLNIWDFEGQEISHQTHQFFLTSQSLYLLVFKCRDQFLMDRAEYWLDTIRARAPKAKVAIVISQCEERTPYVPLDQLQAQYGDLLADEWFFTVGCENGLNIEKLQTFLQRWAADLEFMGCKWPTSYGKAETAIKAKAKKDGTHIERDKLHAIFAKGGVNEDGFEDAAAAMSRLGVMTQFPDCPDLRDFIVLRPQWLTKAISKVMEEKELSDDKGEITLKRMEGIWKKAGYRGMFATFHNCMKEFELCYDLEDASQSCLVPLRFGYVRPTIPWSNGHGLKARRVEYKLNVRPPMGIMSRFIVKTHHMIVKTPEHPKGVYWHNGVFLRTGEGPLCSEALCEFVPEDRKLCIEVRAAFPQNLSEQIHAYVKAVFSFFSGLEAERSYGCIKVDPETEAEERCSGLHTEKRIYTAISKQRPVLDCEFEDHDVDPRKLIWGFSSFNEFVMAKVVSADQLRRELDKQPVWAEPFLRSIGALVDWVNVNGNKLNELLQSQSALSAEFKQEAELKLHEYLALTSEMLDDRDHTAAPGLISISTKDRSKWNPAGYFKKTYILTPYCECKGNIHPCEDGSVPFKKNQKWWEKTAPWMARGTKLLAAGLQLGFAGMPLALGSKVFDVVKNDVELMKELAKHVELNQGDKKELAGADEVVQGDVGKDLRGSDGELKLTRAALSQLLEEIAPTNYRARQWGSLCRVRMSDNSYRWLCEACAKRSR